ncbi:MAG: O-Antigen ligase [Gaiellales bacterium]|nr:O-Antigen ligase [Gaiellales bacterium]
MERMAAYVVVATAAIGPFWMTYPTRSLGSITLGRAALVGLAMATMALLRSRAPRAAPPLPLLAFLGGIGTLWIVMTSSAATRGCFCAGSWYGYTELATLAGLVAICAALVPRLRMALLVVALAGATMSALLGLLSITDIHQSVTPIVPFAGRIGGTFGNPNFLGFAIAAGVPVAAVLIATGPRWGRGVALPCLALMAVAIEQTYSREAILAAAAGSLIALTLLPATRRRRLAVLIGASAGTALVTVLAYPSFDAARTAADFTAIRALGAAHDLNGWDGNALGPIRDGPSSLSNPQAGVLMATTGRANRGLSFGLGVVPAGQSRAVSFDASSSDAHVPIVYEIADDPTGAGGTLAVAVLDRGWRPVHIRWKPRRDAQAARLFVWQTGAGADLRVRRVVVAGPSGPRAPAVALRGPTSSQNPASEARQEQHYVASRTSAARLGADAFASEPIFGLGWQRFDGYAKARDPQGALATHNEYVRIAAELGILGLIPLLFALGAVAAGVRTLVRRRVEYGVVGGVLTAGIGLLFINGLVTPAASGALAVVAALAASATPWRRGDAAPDSASPEP